MSTETLIAPLKIRTNVRSHDARLHAAAWPLRALLKVSPRLAGPAVARAFCTTWRPPVRPADTEALGLARRVAIPFGRRSLPAWVFGEGPAVLLSHGWSGRGAQLAPLAAALATAGFRAITFDHPAHGEAAGKLTTLPEMASAIGEVDAWAGGAHAVVAHSVGSVVTTLAMARTIAPRRVVYLAPPVDPRAWLRGFARKLGLGPAIDEPLVRGIEARAGVPIAQVDPRTFVGDLETPLLIVHDREDPEVPFAAGEELARKWGGETTFVATEGLGHHKILRSPEVGERVLGFVALDR
ncbi:MAG: alpha/beta hydrolase [Deltaproteobacteria bacterium]|nr:alpha/beta hydrolase [Deltaproteobacteria bacterium]